MATRPPLSAHSNQAPWCTGLALLEPASSSNEHRSQSCEERGEAQGHEGCNRRIGIARGCSRGVRRRHVRGARRGGRDGELVTLVGWLLEIPLAAAAPLLAPRLIS